MQNNKPRVLAYYFAQYHSIPENDAVFGEGFTDWDLFKRDDIDLSSCKKPIDPPMGLGYYNPVDYTIRIRQAELAKQYGIDGFIYYHYWLENKPVMTKVMDAMLEDGEPNMPFCICFANESWKHCYGSKTGEYKSFHADGSTYRQLYDDPARHAEYLQQFFKHKNYIKINDAPVFFIYRLTSDVYRYIDRVSEELKKYDIPRIYIVANTSNYCLSKYDHTPLVRHPDAYSNFLAHNVKHIVNKNEPFYLPDYLNYLPCIPSGLVGWNCIPRHGHTALVNYSPDQITELIYHDLIEMTYQSNMIPIYALFAWNEWGEGACIEPNTIYQNKIGIAIRNAKDRYEKIVNILPHIKVTYGLNNTMIDITSTVVKKCIKEIDIVHNDTLLCKRWNIYIPADDKFRDELFTDPLSGIHKTVVITYKGDTTIYNDTDTIVFTL
jgi:hypothetical protein